MSRHVTVALRIWPFVLGVLIVLGANRLEHWFLPVVKDFVVVDLHNDGATLTMSGYMRKSWSCDFVGVGTVGKTSNGQIDLDMRFLDSDVHTKSRPTGTQGWGPWRISIPITPTVHEIELVAAHRCHPFWMTQTVLANIPIDQPPQ